jgi:arabinogalactan oligomer/maltooligosaccharide transport system permease protein
VSAADTTAAVAGAPAVPVAAEAPAPRERIRFKDTWWRHIVGIVAAVIALFPLAYIVASAFNADQNLSDSTLIPRHLTLGNFGSLIHNNVVQSGGGKADAPFLNWYLNSIIVAGGAAIMTVILGALAAYAFSRFRFKGRRIGMTMLLLIQMFPQVILVVAIYLIVLNVGGIFPAIGLNKLLALIVVYLGGAMGVNVWLMKGFFDTIPAELDESARVDGATPGQVFWGVVLPLALPVLTVVGFISFIFTLNEFIIASAILTTTKHFTLSVGMYSFISQKYGQRWGPFTAGALMALVPVTIAFLFLQKWIVGGLTAGSVKG